MRFVYSLVMYPGRSSRNMLHVRCLYTVVQFSTRAYFLPIPAFRAIAGPNRVDN